MDTKGNTGTGKQTCAKHVFFFTERKTATNEHRNAPVIFLPSLYGQTTHDIVFKATMSKAAGYTYIYSERVRACLPGVLYLLMLNSLTSLIYTFGACNSV